MNSILSFLRAPLNQASVVAIGGSAWACLAGTMSWHAALPIFVGSVVALVLPDNTVAKQDVEQLITDAIQVFQDVHGGAAPAASQPAPAAPPAPPAA